MLTGSVHASKVRTVFRALLCTVHCSCAVLLMQFHLPHMRICRADQLQRGLHRPPDRFKLVRILWDGLPCRAVVQERAVRLREG